MRFAWIRESTMDSKTSDQGQTNNFSLIRMAYNIAFWVFLPPLLTDKIAYSIDFIAFTIVISIRLLLNLYTKNFFKPTIELYERFPFRIP